MVPIMVDAPTDDRASTAVSLAPDRSGPVQDPPRRGRRRRAQARSLILLAACQFLMTLDSSVMNVSIKSVADDLGTSVTGIQTAITLYTLVMAALMITGGKVGAILGRRRALGLGLVVYGSGSLVTAVSPNLTVLLIGWSGLEGLGAALIMPAVVALSRRQLPQRAALDRLRSHRRRRAPSGLPPGR